MSKVFAPFTPEQIAYLEIWQTGLGLHPFTCMGHNDCKHSERIDDGALIPTVDGWACPCGEYKQNWYRPYMVTADIYSGSPVRNEIDYLIVKRRFDILVNMYSGFVAPPIDAKNLIRIKVLRNLLHTMSEHLNVYEQNNSEPGAFIL